jgi:hypothetical protein
VNALDREVFELLDERPDLLAVADAVVSTQAAAAPPASRALPQLLALPAVAAAAAVILVLLAAPWHGGNSSVDSGIFFERALAVIGEAPVIHVIFEDSSSEVVVDVATGAERPRVHRKEVWYDGEHNVMRVRASTDGSVATEYLVHGPGWTTADPAFAGFTTQYRDALADGRARIVGDAEVDGRAAKVIEFERPNDRAAVEQVAVDAETFHPLEITYTSHGGQSSTVLHILRIQSLPYGPALFAPSKTVAADTPYAGTVEQREVPVDEAARALGRAPLGLDRTPDAVLLESAKASRGYGRELKGSMIQVTYGDLEISEARDEAGVRALGIDRGGNPLPPQGSMTVYRGADISWGWLRRDGVTVWLRAPAKYDLLAAARELTPLH